MNISDLGEYLKWLKRLSMIQNDEENNISEVNSNEINSQVAQSFYLKIIIFTLTNWVNKNVEH